MEIIYIGGIFFSLVTAIVLIKTGNSYQQFSDRVLASYFVLASYCAILYLLVQSGKIVDFPHLFKTAAPINFLLPPLAFIYTRSVLINENKFKKTDIFHFLLFILVLINYLPFYFVSSEEKGHILNKIGAANWEGTGFINEDLQFVLRELQVFMYLIFQWLLIAKFKNTHQSIVLYSHASRVLNWLKAFVGGTTVNFFCIVTAVVFLENWPTGRYTSMVVDASDILFGTTYLIWCSYLLLNPSVLYGLPFLLSTEEESSKAVVQVNENVPSSNIDYDLLHSELVGYFQEKHPYLQKNLSITEVSVYLRTSPRNISFLLNSHKGTRFNDFVNTYRLSFVCKKLEEGYLDSFTLESLANEAGFTNYSTFYRAFHKLYSQTPTEFVEKIGKK